MNWLLLAYGVLSYGHGKNLGKPGDKAGTPKLADSMLQTYVKKANRGEDLSTALEADGSKANMCPSAALVSACCNSHNDFGFACRQLQY